MLLGELRPLNPPVTITPIHASSNVYYTIKLTGMTIDGQDLDLHLPDFGTEGGTVLDSGTTFSYLPTAAYLLVKERLRRYARTMTSKRAPLATTRISLGRGAPSPAVF
jgi:hypothetical protein